MLPDRFATLNRSDCARGLQKSGVNVSFPPLPILIIKTQETLLAKSFITRRAHA